jgi:hypothetical protein
VLRARRMQVGVKNGCGQEKRCSWCLLLAQGGRVEEATSGKGKREWRCRERKGGIAATGGGGVARCTQDGGARERSGQLGGEGLLSAGG